MISRLRGTLVGRTPDGFVLDVHGVGYLLAATLGAVRAAERGGEAAVETYLHVREDALQLYGFADGAERQLFLHLLPWPGSGRRSRSRSSPARPPASSAARSRLQDTARFQAIPGVGKKTAERIVLELKEKPVPRSRCRSSRPGRPGITARATRSSSSATPSSRPSRPSPASIPSCRRRSAQVAPGGGGEATTFLGPGT